MAVEQVDSPDDAVADAPELSHPESEASSESFIQSLRRLAVQIDNVASGYSSPKHARIDLVEVAGTVGVVGLGDETKDAHLAIALLPLRLTAVLAAVERLDGALDATRDVSGSQDAREGTGGNRAEDLKPDVSELFAHRHGHLADAILCPRWCTAAAAAADAATADANAAASFALLAATVATVDAFLGRWGHGFPLLGIGRPASRKPFTAAAIGVQQGLLLLLHPSLT